MLEAFVHQLEAVEANPTRDTTLSELAQMVAFQLPRQDFKLLREICGEIADSYLGLLNRDDTEKAQGALLMLQEVVTTYTETTRHLRQKAERTLGTQRKVHREVILQLRGGSRTPSQLAEALGKDRGQISRTLKKLRQDQLVETLQGPGLQDGREKPQALTASGSMLAHLLDPVEATTDASPTMESDPSPAESAYVYPPLEEPPSMAVAQPGYAFEMEVDDGIRGIAAVERPLEDEV
jgi:DNA-binding MarR family transcriptional regulator